ncbi:MAG: hypothetical protein AB2777_16030 [Candidatus Thiodiazotropha endolucinida]
MDPVSKLTRLLEALRLQQARNKRTNKATATTDTKHSASQVESNGELPKKLSLDQLKLRITERINRLPPEERGGDKAVQLFINTVLAWEFGDELLQSDSFSKYSKQIRMAINSDSKLNYEFNHLIKSLSEVKY